MKSAIIILLFMAAFVSFGKVPDEKKLVAERQIFEDTLLKDKEAAIAFAEPILFKSYGRKHIRQQKPYKCNLINGYWQITGTLPKKYKGGVFKIMLDPKNGNVIEIIHGK